MGSVDRIVQGNAGAGLSTVPQQWAELVLSQACRAQPEVWPRTGGGTCRQWGGTKADGGRGQARPAEAHPLVDGVWHNVPSAAGMLLVMHRLLLLRHHNSLQTSCGPRCPLRLRPSPPTLGEPRRPVGLQPSFPGFLLQPLAGYRKDLFGL